uniref:HTH CENPB-type domain-containing protein n=1 Tax=Glossina brevipalpis TaxID=37001 RepID=A0A1A9WL48_9MUSC
MEKMEQSLTMWIEDITKKRLLLDGNVVKQKALKIFNYLKETEQPSTDEDNHQFVASKRWFENFKKRHSLHSLKIQGERASADAEAADKYSVKLAKIIKEHDYLPDQIFYADETDEHLRRFFRFGIFGPLKRTCPMLTLSGLPLVYHAFMYC